MNPNDVSQDVFDAAFAEFQRAQDDCPPGSIVRATGGWPLRCAIAAAIQAEREACMKTIADLRLKGREAIEQLGFSQPERRAVLLAQVEILARLEVAIRARGGWWKE